MDPATVAIDSRVLLSFYSDVHDQLPLPAIVAKPYAWLQEPYFCNVVIFVNIVRFPPVRYCRIS